MLSINEVDFINPFYGQLFLCLVKESFDHSKVMKRLLPRIFTVLTFRPATPLKLMLQMLLGRDQFLPFFFYRAVHVVSTSH